MNTNTRHTILAEIEAERVRQIEQEGWTAEHDDHTDGDIARAAACYARYAGYTDETRAEFAEISPRWWPWADRWWKPTTRKRDLVKAAALIVAELERLERNGH